LRRLLLFDIDGTLVRGGPAKTAFREAMVETFGTAGSIEAHPFGGKTDPQIARELLRGIGMDDRAIDAGLSALWERYLELLEERLPALPMTLLPGVAGLFDALAGMRDVGLGLVTGNIVRGAELKLGSAGLLGYFRVGGFGSDHENRDELPAVALLRAREAWGVAFHPSEVLVVGDTPRDVQCGRKVGARTLAVATGPHPVEDLQGCGADWVFRDLADTEAVVSVLMSRAVPTRVA
jgi:phosphoglycolate phosphatase-like HAD superfamily hydrolase